jgi:hypothetical protein
MKILVTGDIYRAGQTTNIERLASMLSVQAETMTGTGLPFMDWLDRQQWGPYPFRGYDLVVGFELPVWVRDQAYPWIDVRRHPLRFDSRDLWSVMSNRDAIGVVVEAHGVTVEPRSLPREPATGEAAFMCQTVCDVAMLDGTRVIRPDDVLPAVIEFARRFRVLHVVPHPAEKSTVWPDAVRRAVPNAALAWAGAYDVMHWTDEILTISSSTGVEAPYFGARTNWIKGPMPHSQPVEGLELVLDECIDALVTVAA